MATSCFFLPVFLETGLVFLGAGLVHRWLFLLLLSLVRFFDFVISRHCNCSVFVLSLFFSSAPFDAIRTWKSSITRLFCLLCCLDFLL
ncbi:MAG: hypothetical protein CSB23_01070 [Deltaproteobacteria bacterium]|nr:MAG: hypothetical protein CSB23_01070 [Deltaproteobacteria bacterium]